MRLTPGCNNYSPQDAINSGQEFCTCERYVCSVEMFNKPEEVSMFNIESEVTPSQLMGLGLDLMPRVCTCSSENCEISFSKKTQ